MKTCTRCNETKPVDAFPKQRTYCKKCWQKQCRPAIKRWAQKNKKKCNTYTKKWRELNLSSVKEAKAKYRKENKDKLSSYLREYRIKKSSITRAHDAVKYALQTGKLIRQPCFCCGDEAVAHHPSYARDMRLSVVWLCRLHHAEVHA